MWRVQEADNVLKKVKVYESKCMNNEVTIEEYDKNLRQTTKMASDNEQKLDELSRKLGVQGNRNEEINIDHTVQDYRNLLINGIILY